jgi:Molybdopterin-binding domain of aldehyde dehydrogenase
VSGLAAGRRPGTLNVGQPYSWYKDFVLAGAAEHQLPPEYVESRIGAVHASRDPDPQREQTNKRNRCGTGVSSPVADSAFSDPHPLRATGLAAGSPSSTLSPTTWPRSPKWKWRRTQVQGGIVFGITAALYGEITLRDGRVQQANFDTYQMLRMNEAPVIEIYVVASARSGAQQRDLCCQWKTLAQAADRGISA